MEKQNKANAILNRNNNIEADEVLDFDLLEEQLEAELEGQMEELKFLESERSKIGNPDALGETVKNVVWEQFLNQIAVTAGEDFIKDNRGLTLDLRSEAHIQTTENFANGKIATHNTEIDYQKRYDDWQSNFQKDPNIEHNTSNYRYNEEQQVWEQHDTRSDSWKKVLNKGARSDFDKGRPTGSTTNNTNMDHIVSAGEIIRDPEANAHLTREEQIEFANSETNLNLMDSAANQSKGDSTMTEFLESERDGKKAAERFGFDEEELKEKDKQAREEYEKQKKEGEERSIKAGKESQKKEAFRIGGKALRAIVMLLLAELIKEIIGKLVIWLKNKDKSLDSLVESLKVAIKSFVNKLKMHLINAGNVLVTTIATAIMGPVVSTIKKVWILLKQGWKSLKDAIAFLRNPANKNMPISIKLLEVGKIVMAGLSGVGAIVLGEVIEKGLMTIPVFAVEIPLLGSLANIIGIFMGAVVAGIIGAIAINLIDKAIAKKKKSQLLSDKIDKGNEILATQQKLLNVTEKKFEKNKADAINSIEERHKQAEQIIRESVKEIFSDDGTDNSIDFDEIDAALDDLLD